MPSRNSASAPKPVADGDALASGQVLRDVIDTVRQPLLVLDPAFAVVHANLGFLSTFRVTPEETVGYSLFALANGQWDVEQLRSLQRERPSAQAMLTDVEIDGIFPGVGRRVLSINARLVAHAADAPRMVVLAIEDVTQRRIAELRLAAQHRELKRSNAALREFASIASHDLQEPLRKIVSFGERLNDAAGPVLDGAPRQYLERMMDAAGRMRLLINDLLTYSEVTTRVHPFAPTDLAIVAREVIADLEAAVDESGATIDVGPLPVIDADGPQMRQLLQNLLGNALKYHREGAPVAVRVRATNGGAYCTLTIEDNGIGFDAEHAEKIFRMFERLHSRAQYAGTGIGLAICRQIVDRHGGTISASGSAGAGATFTVTLPMSQAAPGYGS